MEEWRLWRRRLLRDGPAELEGPHRVAPLRELERIAAGEQRDVLLSVHFVGRDWRVGAGSGLESPIKLSPIDLVLHVRMRTTL